MDVDLIFKIAAVGILVAVLNQLLVRSGREEQAMMTTLAGLVVVHDDAGAADQRPVPAGQVPVRTVAMETVVQIAAVCLAGGDTGRWCCSSTARKLAAGAGTGGVRGGGGPGCCGGWRRCWPCWRSWLRPEDCLDGCFTPLVKTLGIALVVPAGRRTMPGRRGRGPWRRCWRRQGPSGRVLAVPAAGAGGMGAVEDAGMRKSMADVCCWHGGWWLPAWGGGASRRR